MVDPCDIALAVFALLFCVFAALFLSERLHVIYYRSLLDRIDVVFLEMERERGKNSKEDG